MVTSAPSLYSQNVTLDVSERLRVAPDQVALRRLVHGSWIDVTMREFHAHVVALAHRLVAHGVQPGSHVGILAVTSYEWTVLDYALWWTGAVSVPIYETSSHAQIRHIVSDANLTHLYCARDEQVAQVRNAQHLLSELSEVATIAELLAEAEDSPAFDDLPARQELGSDSVATIIYTSGTTGSPRGCVLTHGNLRAELGSALLALPQVFEREGASTLLFLPLAHVFSRIIQIGCLRAGVILGHTADIADLSEHLASFSPTFLLGVPRVFEKTFDAASAQAYTEGKGVLFDKAARTAIEYSQALDTARGPGPALRAKQAFFARSAYHRIHEQLGGRVEYAICGGAPLGDRLGHFFRGIGLPILEGYGLTETSGAVIVNRADAQRIGTVGRAMAGVQLRTSPEGELLVRAPQVFAGYWNEPSPTSHDDWLHTGDLAEIDDDGFVRMTGRHTEVFVTAGGKNVSPGPIEDLLRSHPWVAQALIVGDGKPYVCALVTIDKQAYAADLESEELNAAIQKAVDAANRHVSRAEAIRKFVIIADDWDEASGYLTPSMKVRRYAVLRDYHDLIEGIYAR
jgi:long-chain acyl-CoA synthetase